MQSRQRQFGSFGFSVVALCAAAAPARAAETPDEAAARLNTLQQQIATQTEHLESLKKAVAEQEATIKEIRRVLGLEVLAAQRGGTAATRSSAAAAPAAGDAASGQQVAQQSPSSPTPVGQAPESAGRPEVAPIFEQPGVLTPKDKFVLEPSFQYSYSSSNRVALVGYTIIPAILIGVIDIREVKRNTYTATLTGRYGLTNRFELEARLPYVHRKDTSIGREFLQGAAISTPFDADGSGIGDVEVTGRYQLNDGGMNSPYYVASLRLKTRTGKDPFEVDTTTSLTGLRGGVQKELPTGSGFYGIQPALTVLYPSDPAVFFGTVSYLHSIKRKNVSILEDGAPRDVGAIQPGGVFGFNFGMGLALNERSSFSIGYDHSSVGKTEQNGQPTPDSVRVQLGTLLLGYSYRLDAKRSLNISLGAGVTRDTPDVTLTVRVPTSF